ncbi:MAG TPA: glycosyltransferase family 2 protein [Flexivirga sp.]|uniref:glycosyltransferase family 2 protein n=1 Tax=Flexivirga sp. TaxID=1962927 RepID=UPI002D05A4BF|nr:glycosyltransferase family 2 protein [Flexivirga sp.]HWC23319.1 glycosyltransferase family 2 protein [Flexivirga sp.]
MESTLGTPDSVSGVPTVGVAMLHMGDRPTQLRHALETLRAQEGVELDVVVVGNGWRPEGLPDWVRSVHLPENVGIPEGRNVAAREARGEFIYFYDDDAALPTTDVIAELATRMRADDRIAVVQPRGVDPDGKPSPRRWVPRFQVRGGGRPGPAAWFWEAAVLVRRKAFEQVGGWPGHFFFGHEGVDLAWRLADVGWRIEYAPSVVIHHPATDAARHEVYFHTNARNRVWVAKRNLPAVLVPVYLGFWTGITVVRVHDHRALRTWIGGFVEGVRTDAGDRRPMTWRTVCRLARTGRPPVV